MPTTSPPEPKPQPPHSGLSRPASPRREASRTIGGTSGAAAAVSSSRSVSSVRRAKAVEHCESAAETEDSERTIGFRTGDIVVVMDTSDSEWWKGYVEGKPAAVGFFPASSVQMMLAGSPAASARSRPVSPTRAASGRQATTTTSVAGGNALAASRPTSPNRQPVSRVTSPIAGSTGGSIGALSRPVSPSERRGGLE